MQKHTSLKELVSFIWRHISEQKRRFYAIFILDFFCFSADMVIWPLILSELIDTFGRYDLNRHNAWPALWPLVFAGTVLVIYVEVTARTMGFLMAKGQAQLDASIRMTMFNHVQKHSPRYFADKLSGTLVSKITDIVMQVELIVDALYFPIVPLIGTCFLGLIVLWFVNPIFTWLFLVWSVVHLSICIFFARKVDHYEHVHGEARSTLLGRILDSLSNHFAVNLFYRFAHERKLIQRFQKEEYDTNLRVRYYAEKLRVVLSISYFIFAILGLFGLMLYMWIHGKITTGQVIQVFTTMWGFGLTLWTASQTIPTLFQAVGVARQAHDLLKDPQDLGAGTKELKITSGEIVFKDVSFRYGENALFTGKNAHIRGGEKVGLVGYSGAGKSTFVNLILRFFPIEKGEVFIDGQNVVDLSLKSLRSHISLIPQDPVLFHRTIRENILYAKPDATDEEMIYAAKLAHCDEFIRKIPGGYDALVGDRGSKLSGGEKQRIAIARAILADTPILILDEATSALDSVTERHIQSGLEELMQGRTTIVIAHRLSTLSKMDRLLVFDRGKIVEEGTHDALLELGGHYAHMWRTQVGGFLPAKPLSSAPA